MQLPLRGFRGLFKPSGAPRINWADPLTDGLCAYWLMTPAQGGLLELVHGGRTAFASGQVVPFQSLYGAVAKFTAQLAGPTLSNAYLGITTKVSMFGHVRCTKSGCVAYGRAANAGHSTPYLDFGAWCENSGNTHFRCSLSDGTTTTVNVASFSDSLWHFLGGTYDGTTVVAYGDASVATAGMAIGANTVRDGGQNFVFGGSRSSPGEDFTGDQLWNGLWNRALTSVEKERLRLDPFCFLIWPEDDLFALMVAAGTAAYSLTAAAGNFSLTGVAAGLRATRTLSMAAGAYTLTGKAAGLVPARKVTASTGAYTLTGVAAGLLAARKLNSAAGAYVLTGIAAAFLLGKGLTAGTGSFTLTGVAAGLRATRKITAAVGSFTLSGQAAGLLRGLLLTAAAGTYTLTGKAASLLYGRVIQALTGAYTLAGQIATLAYSGAAPVLVATATASEALVTNAVASDAVVTRAVASEIIV